MGYTHTPAWTNSVTHALSQKPAEDLDFPRVPTVSPSLSSGFHHLCTLEHRVQLKPCSRWQPRQRRHPTPQQSAPWSSGRASRRQLALAQTDADGRQISAEAARGTGEQLRRFCVSMETKRVLEVGGVSCSEKSRWRPVSGRLQVFLALLTEPRLAAFSHPPFCSFCLFYILNPDVTFKDLRQSPRWDYHSSHTCV